MRCQGISQRAQLQDVVEHAVKMMASFDDDFVAE